MTLFLPCGALALLARATPIEEPIQDPGPVQDAPAPQPEAVAWEFSANVLYSDPPGSEDRLTPIVYAERGPLHLELRHNYEDLETTSFFAGWTFEVDGQVELAFTPMLGVVVGQTDGIAPGAEVDLAWKRVAWYVEAEYLFDSDDSDDNFFYSWSTLMYGLTDRLSAGLVTERSKLVDTEFELQRGLALQVTTRHVYLALYYYNPDSDDDYVVASVAFSP